MPSEEVPLYGLVNAFNKDYGTNRSMNRQCLIDMCRNKIVVSGARSRHY